MKENILITAVVGMFIILMLSATGVINGSDNLGGYNDPTAEVIDVIGTEASPTQFATSTCAGCTSLPTTTSVFFTAGYSFVDFNSKHIATHTVSDLHGTLYFSNDDDCQASTTDPTIAWFQESERSTASGVSTLRQNSKAWTEARVKGANYLNWGVTEINARCIKAEFYTNSTTDDSYLWVEASIW